MLREGEEENNHRFPPEITVEGSYRGKTCTYSDVTLPSSNRGGNRLGTPRCVPAGSRPAGQRHKGMPAPGRAPRGPGTVPSPPRTAEAGRSPRLQQPRCASGDTAPPRCQPNSHPERQLLTLISWFLGSPPPSARAADSCRFASTRSLQLMAGRRGANLYLPP